MILKCLTNLKEIFSFQALKVVTIFSKHKNFVESENIYFKKKLSFIVNFQFWEKSIKFSKQKFILKNLNNFSQKVIWP